MDHFGIGAAMAAMVSMYISASRRSGRTTSLVESLTDGDRVVFLNEKEARRVDRLCLERGVSIKTMVMHPTDTRRLFQTGPSDGRTIFDHSWVESFYALAIERARADLDQMERETSGFGAAHRETRRLAEELSRFRM